MEIENRLFCVKDDGFGEDRQVFQHHHADGDELTARRPADTAARQMSTMV